MIAPRTAAVIPCKNEVATIAACIQSLRDQKPALARIVVVDNGSTDGSRQAAEGAADIVIDVQEGSIGRLRNVGAAAAGDVDYLAFVDADMVVYPGWLAAAIEALADADIATARSEAPATGTWVQRRWAALEARQADARPRAWSQQMVLTRATFDSLGGFDEVMPTYEDWDVSNRVTNAGGRVKLVPAMRAVHHGFPVDLRGIVRRERWHTSTPGWLPRMSLRSRALVLAAPCWLGAGAAATAVGAWRRDARFPLYWLAASVTSVGAAGAILGSPRHAMQDGALLTTWSLARASRLVRGFRKDSSQPERGRARPTRRPAGGRLDRR